MTTSKKDLRDIREASEKLAKMLNAAYGDGYVVNVSMDAVTGTLSKFEVTRAVPVDLNDG